MARLRRILILFILATLGSTLFAVPAQASGLAEADKAAHWLATQAPDGRLDDGFSVVGATADGLIALASAQDPALQPTIDAMLATVKSGASSYVSGGGASAAAKLAVVAAAYDIDPASFGGVDLTAALSAGVEADGAVGKYPSAFASGLTMAGFARSGMSAPSVMTTWLVGQQNADGGFGYAGGQPSDADNTAMAILGLLTDDSPAADAALTKAVDWAEAAQNADGSWDGYVPVNSTCIMGSALIAAGFADTGARQFAVSKQLANGAITDGSGANIMATSQCGPLLGGVSFLDVEWTPGTQTASPSPTTGSPSTTKATTKPAVTAVPSPAASTPAGQATEGRGVPARTGVEDEVPLAPLALGAVLVAVAAAVRRA